MFGRLLHISVIHLDLGHQHEHEHYLYFVELQNPYNKMHYNKV